MSYILEALRKSEQERNPTEVPSLQTHHPMIHKEAKSKAIYWIFGIALLLINGLLMAYIFFDNKKSDAPVTITKTNTENSVMEKTEQVDAAKIETSEVQDEVVEVKPIVTPPVKEVIAKPTPKQEPKLIEPTITQLDRASIPDIFDLDYAFQQKIPDMEFSTHIYVSGGGSFVIINGKSLSDGMAVDRGLVIVKILSDGVILRFKGRQFFLGSMTNWLRD